MVVKSFYLKERRAKVLSIARYSMDFCHARMMKVNVEYETTEGKETKTIVLSNGPAVMTGGKVYGNRQPADFEKVWDSLKEGDFVQVVHLGDDNWVFLRG